MIFPSFSVIPFMAIAASAMPSTSSLPRLAGLNFAGYEFGIGTQGEVTYKWSPFDNDQFKHFASQSPKVNLARIPIGWNYLEPTIGEDFDSTLVESYKSAVQTALDQNMYVIIDLHNYARRNNAVVNQGGPTKEQFANTWSKIAKTFQDPKIIFGLMNEPHDLELSSWVPAVQAAVDAIRDAGAKDNLILLPGTSWTGIQHYSEYVPQLLKIEDKAHSGDPSRLIIEGHLYLDSDSSGKDTTCVRSSSDEIKSYADFLKQNNRHGIITEIGGSNDQSCQTYLSEALKSINDAFPSLLGFAVWSAGSFKSLSDSSQYGYILALTPDSNGSDQAIWTNAILPAIKES